MGSIIRGGRKKIKKFSSPLWLLRDSHLRVSMRGREGGGNACVCREMTPRFHMTLSLMTLSCVIFFFLICCLVSLPPSVTYSFFSFFLFHCWCCSFYRFSTSVFFFLLLASHLFHFPFFFLVSASPSLHHFLFSFLRLLLFVVVDRPRTHPSSSSDSRRCTSLFSCATLFLSRVNKRAAVRKKRKKKANSVAMC